MKNEMGGAWRTYGGEERGIAKFYREIEGKRPLGRPRHRWEDNIKIYLQAWGGGSMDGIDLAQEKDRWWALVNAVINLWVP